ncbi:putative phospholipid-transporting ATPase IIB [Liparis tanakae]|uniref:Putative phospholipid-transporting ATPase IIB n=1 Tax=Liparis tanakae TaxID=230148 RepID=A0A4Z2EAH1_9TELE|nr:putative phospholipid-transporting ATPase IIB [Liparis tanakae]
MMSEDGFENDESDYQTLPRARVHQRRRGLGWFLLGGWKVLCGRYLCAIAAILLGRVSTGAYPLKEMMGDSQPHVAGPLFPCSLVP